MKRLLLILFGMAILAGLAACSGGESSDESGGEKMCAAVRTALQARADGVIAQPLAADIDGLATTAALTANKSDTTGTRLRNKKSNDPKTPCRFSNSF